MTATSASLDGFQGVLLHPHDDGYDDARRLWNGAIDRRPGLIARCANTADVAAAVGFGVRHDLLISVRGGGHSIPGHSVCDGGLMIDLSGMRQTDIDGAGRRAQVGPGVLLAGYDAAAQVHHLASPGGEVSHTGVAGLTLGGGVGWLSRRFGLACDSLVEAELVTATGEVLLASEANDPELLWALRGGGGNFGVVTRFTFRLQEVRPMLAGAVMVPLERGGDALDLFRSICAQAPEELSLALACITAPPAPFVPPALVGRPIVAISMAWVGSPQQGDPWAARLRSLRPDVDLLTIMPYVALQQLFDDSVPPGAGYYVKSEWLRGLDDQAIVDLLAAAGAMPGTRDQILLRHLGGAIRDVTPDATAFSFRDAEFMLTISGAWTVRDDDPEPHREWARDLWTHLRRVTSGGAYINQLDLDEGADRVRQAYSTTTWTRLVEQKQRLDPHNAFRLNTNIPPA